LQLFTYIKRKIPMMFFTSVLVQTKRELILLEIETFTGNGLLINMGMM